MKNWKGTQGEWRAVSLEATEVYTKRNEVHYGNDGECVAEYIACPIDAKLIADAGNTINKCDLFPSELLKQRNELLKALRSCVMSMKVHPDNESNSEFEGFVNNGIEAINNALK